MAYRFFYLDFETASEVDLRKVGAAVYARHPSTRILCMSCAYGNGFVHTYKDIALIDSVVWEAARSSDVMFLAHNALFELEIIRHVLGIHIEPDRFMDTMAIAGHLTMMDSLEGVGKIIGEYKSESGQRLISKLCHLPNPHTPQNNPKDFNELYAYCKQDVIVSRTYHQKFGKFFTDVEQTVWVATAKINLNGLPVDMGLVNLMSRQVDKLKSANDKKCLQLCGMKTSQTVKIAKYCNMTSVAKVPIRTMLRKIEEGTSNLRDEQIQVLKLRQENSLSSLAKLKRVQVLQAEDTVFHGFKYAGASRTGRWSGRGLQPQNLPRGYKGEKLESTLQNIRNGKATLTDISSSIRAIITARKGFKIFVGDYSQIECRILAYLAGVTKLLQAFENEDDPYKIMAGNIYHKPVESITESQRFMGKQATLGCGYALGGGTFQEMLFNTYDVDISLGEATEIVYAYRALFYQVPLYWDAIFDGFLLALNGVPNQVGKIKFDRIGNKCVTVQLISGRKLYYWDCRQDWDGVSYSRPLPNGKKSYRRYLYGGAIVGHICQGTSRDITAVATVRLFRRGWNPIGFVHDEILTHDKEDKTVKEFKDIMMLPISWAKGIPITGECFKNKHYQKG